MTFQWIYLWDSSFDPSALLHNSQSMFIEPQVEWQRTTQLLSSCLNYSNRSKGCPCQLTIWYYICFSYPQQLYNIGSTRRQLVAKLINWPLERCTRRATRSDTISTRWNFCFIIPKSWLGFFFFFFFFKVPLASSLLLSLFYFERKPDYLALLNVILKSAWYGTSWVRFLAPKQINTNIYIYLWEHCKFL